MLVDLKSLLKQKMRIKIDGFKLSEVINLSTVGVHGCVVLKHNPDDKLNKLRNTHNPKELEHIHQKLNEAVELGTSIKLCDNPYAKTKVIRFTNRFTLVNKMNFPIVVRCVESDFQYIITAQS